MDNLIIGGDSDFDEFSDMSEDTDAFYNQIGFNSNTETVDVSNVNTTKSRRFESDIKRQREIIQTRSAFVENEVKRVRNLLQQEKTKVKNLRKRNLRGSNKTAIAKSTSEIKNMEAFIKNQTTILNNQRKIISFQNKVISREENSGTIFRSKEFPKGDYKIYSQGKNIDYNETFDHEIIIIAEDMMTRIEKHVRNIVNNLSNDYYFKGERKDGKKQFSVYTISSLHNDTRYIKFGENPVKLVEDEYTGNYTVARVVEDLLDEERPVNISDMQVYKYKYYPIIYESDNTKIFWTYSINKYDKKTLSGQGMKFDHYKNLMLNLINNIVGKTESDLSSNQNFIFRLLLEKKNVYQDRTSGVITTHGFNNGRLANVAIEYIRKYNEEGDTILALTKGEVVDALVNAITKSYKNVYKINYAMFISSSLTITIDDKASGIWHFEIVEAYAEYFKDALTYDKPCTVYSSRAKNFDCVLFCVLKAFVQYVIKKEITNPQDLINRYRMENISEIDAPLNITVARKFAYWLIENAGEEYKKVRTVKILFSSLEKITNNNSSFSNGTLTANILIYENHSFLTNGNDKNRDIIKNGLKVLPIEESTFVKEIDVDFEGLIDNLKVKKIEYKEPEGISEKLIIPFDIETADVTIREMEEFYNITIEEEDKSKIIAMPAMIQYGFAKAVIDSDDKITKFYPIGNGELKVYIDECKHGENILTNFFTNLLLILHELPYKPEIIMVAHNGAKFDIPALAPFIRDFLILRGLEGAAKNNPIYSFEFEDNLEKKYVYKIRTRDSRQYIDGTTLTNLCKMYGIDSYEAKHEIVNKNKWFKQYTNIIKAFMKKSARAYTHYNKKSEEDVPGNTFMEQFRKYSYNDITSLYGVIVEYEKSYHNNAPCDLIQQSTIGKVSSASLAKKPLFTMLNGADSFGAPLMGEKIKESSIGGRTVMTSRGFVNRVKFTEIPNEMLKKLFSKSNYEHVLKMKEYYSENHINEQVDRLIYLDAVSLYPSALISYRYPKKIIGKINAAEWSNIYNNMTTFKQIEKFINTGRLAILEVTLKSSEGMVNCIPDYYNGALRYNHYGYGREHTTLVTSVDLARFKVFNKGTFIIHTGLEFSGDKKMFEPLRNLFNMRKNIKEEINGLYTIIANRDSLIKMTQKERIDFILSKSPNRYSDVAISKLKVHLKNILRTNEYKEIIKVKDIDQLGVKKIMNSVYGKLLQKAFNVKMTTADNVNDPWIGTEKYGGQILNKFATVDNQIAVGHIGAFCLSYSKYMMDRVIANLGYDGTDEYNNFITQKYPFYSTDTDSFACYESAFLKAKEYLNLPGADIIGGFHNDIEVPGADRNLEVIAAIWVVPKTYILLCRGEDKDGNFHYAYHRRGKGLIGCWKDSFDLLDYYNISQMSKEDRKIKQHATHSLLAKKKEELTKQEETLLASFTRFDVDKKTGFIEKIPYDKAFDSFQGLGKHRSFLATKLGKGQKELSDYSEEDLMIIRKTDPLFNNTPYYLESN